MLRPLCASMRARDYVMPRHYREPLRPAEGVADDAEAWMKRWALHEVGF